MSKYLKSPGLLRRETPENLDRRILLAGAIAAAGHRRRVRKQRLVGALSGLAAAVVIAAVATWGVDLGSGGRSPLGGIQVADTPAIVPSVAAMAANPAAAANIAVPPAPATGPERESPDDWTELEQGSFNLASQLNSYQDDDEDGVFYSQV